jgi:hypothetical protein
MTDTKNQPDEAAPPAAPAEAVARKPYQPPRVVSHDPLEVITGSCTPAPPGKQNPATCTFSQQS